MHATHMLTHKTHTEAPKQIHINVRVSLLVVKMDPNETSQDPCVSGSTMSEMGPGGASYLQGALQWFLATMTTDPDHKLQEFQPLWLPNQIKSVVLLLST